MTSIREYVSEDIYQLPHSMNDSQRINETSITIVTYAPALLSVRASKQLQLMHSLQ